MSTLTISGASGSTITIQNALNSTDTEVSTLVNSLNTKIKNNTAVVYNGNISNNNPPTNETREIISTRSISDSRVTIPNNTKYLILDASSDYTEISRGNLGTNPDGITILAATSKYAVVDGSGYSGTVINTSDNFTFWGNSNIIGNTGTNGNWIIDLLGNNSFIHTGNGNSTINLKSGSSTLYLDPDGSNIINYYNGTYNLTDTSNKGAFINFNVYGTNLTVNDNIGTGTVTGSTSSAELTGFKNFTIYGDNNVATLKATRNIVDMGQNSTISAAADSTVTGGTSSQVNFTSTGSNSFQAGNNSTITAASSSLSIIQGSGNTINSQNNVTFYNGTGITNATVDGSGTLFGANGLDFTLNSNTNNTISGSSLFVAGAGNETLNAVNYHNSLKIYANTISGSVANLVATGTSNDDLMAAGIGNSTFTGGSGNNVFLFSKTSDAGGTTVITDFSQSAGNQIMLANYGFNSNDVTQILQNATTDSNGSAILNLGNHQITLQNVAASDLKISQFNFIG